MGPFFIPLTLSRMRCALLALGMLSCVDATAQTSAAIAWGRMDEACPSFLHAAREVVIYREAGDEFVDVGGVAFPRASKVAREKRIFHFEAPAFSAEQWSFRISTERCEAVGLTRGARALSAEESKSFREKLARLRAADASLATMEAAVVAQDRAGALAAARVACDERRTALGASHALVASCELEQVQRSLFSGLYQEALSLAQHAHSSFAALPPGARGLDALAARNGQAQAFFFLSRPAEMYEAAKEAFEGRLRLLGALHADTLLSEGGVAIALQRLGRLDESLPIYEEVMRRQVEREGDSGTDAIRAKVNLSGALQESGDWDRVATLQSEVYQARRAKLGEADVATLGSLHDLGSALWDAGRATEALVLTEQALPRFLAHLGEGHVQTLRIKTLLGSIYQGLGRDEEALPLFREVYAARRKSLGDAHWNTALAATNLAATLLNLERPQDALALAQDALGRMPSGAARVLATERNLQHLKASALLRTGEPRKALETLETELSARALSADEVRKATPAQLADTLVWAHARSETGAAAEALEAIRTVHRGSAERFGPDHFFTLEATAQLADLLARGGQIDAALALLAQYVDRNERRMREGISASAVNRGSLALRVRERPYTAGYRTYIRLLAARDPVRALEIAELTKARSLAETIARPADDATPLQVARIRYARAEERVAASETGSPQYLRAVADRSKAEDDLRKVRGPRARASQAGDVRDSLRRTLPPGTVLIHFVVSGDRVVAITANSSAQVRARDLGTIAGLADSVEAFRRVLTSPAPATERLWSLPDGRIRWSLSQPHGSTRVVDLERVGRELSRRLLDPLAADLGKTRNWIICPDGPLAFLPFEALSLGRQSVLEARSVRYAPSLTSLAVMPATVSTAAAQQFLGIGVSRFLGAAGTWRDLPEAQAEVQAIGQLFPAPQRRLLQGSSASEASIRALASSGELRRFRYIHFATHAFLSARGSSLSGVVLSGSDTDKEDGVITAAEWPTYRLSSDLVVLSACDTGLGQPVAGEGVVGLPYALLSAGSRGVVLTLWSVPDSSAADFMPRFYKRLLAGKPAAEALRETKLEFARSKGPWSSPRHWAPYVLYGAT